MDGVTDAAFRHIMAVHGRPALSMTEFTAAEGIRAGAERLLQDFLYSESERPAVAQVFGSDPTAFFVAGAVAAALGFDGVDINMGCPAKNVTERGAGAALIRDPQRALEIIRQTRAGIQAWANGASLEEAGVHERIIPAILAQREAHGNPERRELPVSVKTRVGYDSIVIEEWVHELLKEKPAAITIHGRTLKQLYSGLADWEAIARAAAIIHETETIVLGNGDVSSLEDAHARCLSYGVDGVLIGRAAFGNPWLFSGHTPTEKERLAVALEHARYFKTITNGFAFQRMRKHLLDYTRGFEGAKEVRVGLMRVQSIAEVEAIIEPLL
jgi:tRNA-dihydrouridine synthase B